MASYTIELRKVCTLYGRENVIKWFSDYNIEDYLLPAQLKVFNNQSLFSKEQLANDIIDFYYMREIGLETPALFKHYVKIYMKKIMQAKLPLIYTNLLEYDPLINENYTETFDRTNDGTASNTENSTSSNTGSSSSNSNSNSSGLSVNSDTPQRTN